MAQIKNWDELEAAAASVGVTMDGVYDAATGLPLRKPVRTPTCPACGAKFQHDSALLRCKQCGMPDEISSEGMRAIRRYQKQVGLAVSRGARFSRRKHAHGRARGGKGRRS